MMRKLLRRVLEPLEALIGPLDAHRKERADRPRRLTTRDGLASFRARWPAEEPATDRPVFLFSAGWRSGSTLLQRLVMTDPRAFIWGEPYDHCDLVRALARSLTPFGSAWPPDRFLYRPSETSRVDLPEEWIANLYPPAASFREAHRQFYRALYADTARTLGAERWGFKEVRLGVEEAEYLGWLFPRARFVFLVRDPYDAYRSYRGVRSWYDRWPDRPVRTPRAFGAHWRRLASGFVEKGAELGLVVRFEELAAGSATEELGRHLDLELDPAVLERRVVGQKGRSSGPRRRRVPALERRLLRREVGAVAAALGYG